jgi:hypothetical protein
VAPIWRDKAGDFNLGQASGLQAVHQLDLDGGGHGLFFILQTVAGADIDQFDAGRNSHSDVLILLIQ